MRQLTQVEIGRTAFPEIKTKWSSTFQYSNPDRNHNTMCIYCKEEATEIVRDSADLKPFADFYAEKFETYTVCKCPSCGAVWSFYDGDSKVNRGNQGNREG